MAIAAIRVAERPGLQRVGAWMDMLGFRGHFVTKSRGYSTNLGTLRDARAQWRADRDQPDNECEDETTSMLAAWEVARRVLLDQRRGPPERARREGAGRS